MADIELRPDLMVAKRRMTPYSLGLTEGIIAPVRIENGA